MFDILGQLPSAVWALFGALVAWGFARGASKELREESAKLRHLVNTLARALQEGNVIEGVWDENGFLKSIVVHGTGATMHIESHLSADGYKTSPPRKRRFWQRRR